jgi:putative ABC transport system ATP-binding protein
LLMLVGPSGSGKTTLVSIIGAMLDQDAGDCVVLDRNPRLMSQTEKVRFRGRLIGFVFQAFNLLPALTALENVAIPLLLNGETRRRATRQAGALLDEVELGSRRDARPGELSGGQQQRVAIARALVHAPRLIVCDEPTSNLDHETGRDMVRLLRGLAREPARSVVVVTHDTRILDFADRVAHMDDGRIVDVRPGATQGTSS